MKFKNPANGYTETATSRLSWLWCFLFGPLYFLFRGNIAHAVLSFILVVMTFGLSGLVYPFFTKSINEKYYLKRGWVMVS